MSGPEPETATPKPDALICSLMFSIVATKFGTKIVAL
jgi:hypothetical protein